MNVYYLSLRKQTPNNDYWDYGFINDFFSGDVWDVGIDFKTHEVNRLPKEKSAVVVIPARHHKGYEEQVNLQLQVMDNVVLFLMGDEEADFEVEKIKHPSIHIWIQNPHTGRHDNYNKLGTGYTPQSQRILPALIPEKTIDVYFSGQITHSRRLEMLDVLNHYQSTGANAKINATKGFTQGVSHEQYYKDMTSSKIAPAPSGAVIPDSFRLFEALECMAVPIADERSPDGVIHNYWDWLFNDETPFPKLTSWDRFYTIAEDILRDWPKDQHKITAWWIEQKRNFAYKIKEQL